VKPWRVAVLGATGAVGRTMLECLRNSSVEVEEVRALASSRSAGTRLPFGATELIVREACAGAFDGIDLALFSAGASASRGWAPVATGLGAWVVDNSSCWRMDPGVPLVVPEVNASEIPERRALIANPNCSTIQLVVVLAPLHRRFGLLRVVVATYQSASGKGQTGLRALTEERICGRASSEVFPGPLLGNVLPHCDAMLEDGYTREEEKMLHEARKILGLPELAVHPTCVRVPVDVAHCEAVFVQTARPVTTREAEEVLAGAPGIRLLPSGRYPTPLAAAGTDPVWVGRLRADRCDPRGLSFWVVADNLRKGAALNAVQIAELLYRREAGRA
jgi:aspartate-semialdehyde dehydrogenase